MAESTVTKTKRDGTITLSDGSGTPKTYTISAEPGDFSFSVPGEAMVDNRDRGLLVGDVRKGDDQNMTGSFSVYFRGGASDDGAAAALIDILNGDVFSYGTAPWVSALGSNAEVKAVNIAWTVEGTAHGDGADTVYTFPKCSLTYDIGEGDTNTITVNWTCHYGCKPVIS